MTRRTFVSSAAASFTLSPLLSGRELSCDILICGAGVGGFAAALAACRAGRRVILTEETDWIGGQLTAQAVPPDEHPWIEQFGCTGSYRAYRSAVRAYYRAHYPLTEAARGNPVLNPGNGSVSRLCHEFRVSAAVLEAFLAPYAATGQLTVLLEHVPVSASTKGDRVSSITVADLHHHRRRTLTAQYFIDATELGDLLPLTGTEFMTGAESQSQTDEPHALAEPQPANNQAFTFCFAVDYLPGEDHTIDPPVDYAFWRDYVPQLAPPWTGPLLSWRMCDPQTLEPRDVHFDPTPRLNSAPGLNLWLYRRIADPANFRPGSYPSGITLVNWPQNDYLSGDLLTAPPALLRQHLRQAKQLSLSLLYWMQTAAPRPDGGGGWKGLRLRGDIVGTEDGLAKSPYIRESRRIEAEFTVIEQHVESATNFPDSVGIGSYRIDLHPSATGSNYLDVPALPFQIPLGALIPRRVENLMPACKNIGTTHITNGCYRLHPVEWNIGEAVGALAAYAIANRQSPRAIRNTPGLLAAFQDHLRRQGVQLTWPATTRPRE